ncbi:hypothetical protein BDZ97DRAFT_1812843 [Flammula alnicola]|nr:hypothetical protein BDZ97DRAFT_1812843 [Flammula alnicola]
MPSWRQSSRNTRPWRKRFSRTRQPPRQKTKTKYPDKPRLIRRYIPRKLDDSKVHPKHPDLRVSTPDKSKSSALKVSGAGQHNAVADGGRTTSRPPVIAEVTAVPNPTPDSGATPAASTTSTVGAGSPLLGAFTFDTNTSGLSIIEPSTVSPIITGIHHTAVVSFSALPPLESFVASTAGSVGIRPSFSTQTRPSSSASATASSGDTQSHQISVALVILVSVGGALFLLGFCIVVKMCTRPRGRPRPTPSLPIMKDLEADEDYYETKESPIFGGEERMSEAIASDGPIWNWVQYPHTKLAGQAQVLAQSTCPSMENQVYPGVPEYTDMRFNLATQAPSSEPSITSQMIENPPGRTVLQNVPPARTMNRLSKASLSSYAPTNVGLPTSNTRQETAFTADGHDVLLRSKSKTNRRMSQPGVDDRKRRTSAHSFVRLAYDGEDVASPIPLESGHVVPDTPVMNSEFEGRARVRSGYFAAGAYPRMSTLPGTSYSIATATRINVGQRNSFVKEKLSHQKSNSKRMRDTQALTYALGLASPRTEYGAPSPQSTLYPDDSMSVMDAKRLRKKNPSDRKPVESVPDVPVIVPMEKPGSTDTLMGMSFGVSQMSLTGLALESASEGEEGREAESSMSSSASSLHMPRTMDKAPRVPSPPPLPSLAQMGLARSNPEAYDNYRSPTYSLYGLYQSADRKSFVAR